MAGLEEDAYVDDQDGGQDRVYAALEAQVGGQYSNIDTSRGVEGVDFGGMQVVQDEMNDIENQVMEVTADDWQPEPSVASEGISEVPAGDQGLVGLS